MSTQVAAGSLRPVRTRTLQVDAPGRVDVPVADRDRARPFLLLHGGGGAATMAGFADLLAERTHSRVLLPTHPGFGGTARPASLANTKALAAPSTALLAALDL